MKKNVILGTIRNYNYSKLEPFIRTLKNTGYDGDIVFFYSEVSKKTLDKLKENGITLVELDIKTQKHCLQFNEIDTIEYNKLPLMSYRFIAYLDFLEKNKGKYRNVFLTDTRDVVFQKNPFDFNIGKNMCFFMLNIDIHGWCNGAENILSAYGEKMYEKTKKKRLSCAGTIIGQIDEMIKYLRLMKKNVYKSNDQMIHSVLLYSGWIKNKKKFSNGKIVLTSGESGVGKLADIKNGVVVNKQNEVINIIHGYNHNDVLTDLFDGKQRSGFIRVLKRNKLTHKIGNIMKSVITRTPFIGKSFRTFYAKFT